MPVKIAVIGCGAVGSSFLYSAIHQNLASEYGILDYSYEVALGQALDLEDSTPYLASNSRVRALKDYSELKDYDFVVITAGRPQKPEETRLEMVKDNAKIISGIARSINDSGFSGIVIICSNPVDVLTHKFKEISNLPAERIIGSGTVLDTSRLRIEISKALNVSPNSIEGSFILGEHGDSSLVTFSQTKVAGRTINRCEDIHFESSPFCCSDYEEKLEKTVRRKAYEIIQRKRATHYGIGAALSKIISAIIFDTHEVLPVGVTPTKGEYGLSSNVTLALPTIVGGKGIIRIVDTLPLNDKEQKKLLESAKVISDNIESIRDLV
ncbi:L-lactate dehydrogenase [Mycoplasma suis]|uniref:L-lactate dehydrogenase n=2 Tax=Mycoplasma suis TaxID=57372 RepID=F0QQS1_MYCSL|nr:L-lactate dehydrogenase [Mycoplasma suis]ADX97841.1 L-lactate dehydrogenase [Mycoplasma suis str. Illinois]CBZ40341.1 L-lactate dehydrogenase [Mycoplasma suis KI3806]